MPEQQEESRRTTVSRVDKLIIVEWFTTAGHLKSIVLPIDVARKIAKTIGKGVHE